MVSDGPDSKLRASGGVPVSRPISPSAPEQRIKLIKSNGRKTSNSSPAGSARHVLTTRVSPRELLVSVDSDDGNLIIAIVALLCGAGVVIAFILS